MQETSFFTHLEILQTEIDPTARTKETDLELRWGKKNANPNLLKDFR